MPRHFTHKGKILPDWVIWEERYQENRDTQYAALAIGRHPKNLPEWAIQVCKDRWANSESFYLETNDIRYALFVIADQPDAPPAWAVEACKEFYEHYDRAVANVLEKPTAGTSNLKMDEELLDEMGLLVFAGLTVNGAATEVAGGKEKAADIRRLTRKWKREEDEDPNSDDVDFVHRRMDRALRKYGKL